MTAVQEAIPDSVLFPRLNPDIINLSYVTIDVITEESDPELARQCWALQASDYKRSGIVTDEAIGKDEALLPEIDKSRGPNVKYYVAKDRQGKIVASLRKISDDFDKLPSYSRCIPDMDPGWADYLNSLSANSDGPKVVEIAALCKDSSVTADVVMALYHHALQDSISAGGDVWFMGIVPKTRKKLADIYGTGVVNTVGAPVPLNELGIVPDIDLTPTVIITGEVFETLSREYEEAHRQRLEADSTIAGFDPSYLTHIEYCKHMHTGNGSIEVQLIEYCKRNGLDYGKLLPLLEAEKSSRELIITETDKRFALDYFSRDTAN